MGSKLAKEQKLPPAEDGYHWKQDRNGKLRYDRNPGRTNLLTELEDCAVEHEFTGVML
jgi:hypothetical protein